jgi:hypothetical protein
MDRQLAMSFFKQFLGVAVFCTAVVGLLASFQAVNAAFPPHRLRASLAPADPLILSQKDWMQLLDHPNMAKRFRKDELDKGIQRLAICKTVDGNEFGWLWPNVPFAAMSCSDQQSN